VRWKPPEKSCPLSSWLHLLARSLTEPRSARTVRGYLTGQTYWLVRFAQRHRAGSQVRTAITEGTANFLVNRWMNKSQQMRWSQTGVDFLLQVRCALDNGKFGSTYGQKFHPANDESSLTVTAA
jgi:hypothetical protein